MVLVGLVVLGVVVGHVAPLETGSAWPILGQNFIIHIFWFIEDITQKSWRLEELSAVGLVWKHVLEEPVNVTSTHAHQIDPDRVTQDHRESEQDPRQIRRLKVEQPEEVHPQERISSAPHVHEHYRERLAEKEEIDEEGEDDHEDTAKEKHHNEVGRLASERALFQHPTVAICEYHVEEKTKAYGAEEEERRHQPPHLSLEDEGGIEIKLERRHKVQVHRQCCATKLIIVSDCKIRRII